MKLKCLFAILILFAVADVTAQQRSPLDSAIRRLADEKNPDRAAQVANEVIKNHRLDKKKDAETIDVLYGTVAVGYAMNKDYKAFDKYIGLIQNKFNQTSFMNMAASKLLKDGIDNDFALKITERTLKYYYGFKDDTTAKPAEFSAADWKRFMDFAQYPYYDTHAQALTALGRNSEALAFQAKAFPGLPEEGIPSSVERYAKLLQLNNRKGEAKELLLKMARRGRLNKGMTEQLQDIYIADNGSDAQLGRYLDSLQRNVQASLIQELKPKMLNRPAPKFALKDLAGKTVNLADFSGKIVVLDLWATWCQPCIASFPAMRVMVKKHPEVVFLFIDVQEKVKDYKVRVAEFIQKGNYPFTVLFDEPVEPGSSQFKILSAYKPNGIPAKYIIDGKGTLRFVTSGFDTDTELINELEAMFAIINTVGDRS